MENTPPPVAAAAPSAANTWHMLCHLSALAGYIIPFGNLLGPFLVWQIKKNEIPSVEAHAKEALNFQLSLLLYCVIAGLLIFVLIGIPLLIAIGLFGLVMIIVATIKTNNGESYRYPLCIRFLK